MAVLKPTIAELPPDSIIFGSSEAMREVQLKIDRIAEAAVPVLIRGESGTGKELVARALHYRGTLANRPFVAVDCGSLVPTLIESELFGYEKGAFTGALRSKQGLLQSADTGTIFLDEIGELPLEMQAKMLRFLQEKEVRPVGSNQKVKVDVRIMAATNRDLEVEYKKGTFRKDLYFRLNVVTIHLPPLRERRSDIPILANWFLERLAPGRDASVSSTAMKALLAYDWPGNVRELENTMERAVALETGRLISLPVLPDRIAGYAGTSALGGVGRHASEFPDVGVDFEKVIADAERQYLQAALARADGVRTRASELLKITYRSFRHYAKKHNL